jgi:tRNA(fMet)-specific endonuclease VapC
MDYLLDTNICIYTIEKKPITVFEKFKKLSVGEVGVSSITLAELNYGVRKSLYTEKNQSALNQFLIPLEIIEFDANASFEYGKIRATLEKSGNPIGALDLLIAAHAKSLGTTLVTNNVKEFERVVDLNIENWAE